MANSIEGLDELFATLSNLGENIKKAGKKAVGQWAKSVQADAKYNAPSKTGDLRNSIKADVKIDEDEIVGKVYTNKEHASYVEFGTGPTGRGTYKYMIKGFSLNYTARKWRVKIPGVGVRYIAGQVSQPFMTTAYIEEKNTKKGITRLEQSLMEDIRKLGGK